MQGATPTASGQQKPKTTLADATCDTNNTSHRSKERRMKACEHCGADYRPARYGQRFCSIACANRSRRKPGITVTCPVCLVPFQILESLLRDIVRRRVYVTCGRQSCKTLARRDRDGHREFGHPKRFTFESMGIETNEVAESRGRS